MTEFLIEVLKGMNVALVILALNTLYQTLKKRAEVHHPWATISIGLISISTALFYVPRNLLDLYDFGSDLTQLWLRFFTNGLLLAANVVWLSGMDIRNDAVKSSNRRVVFAYTSVIIFCVLATIGAAWAGH